jgi:cob(I)alamin adenosyltransferase
MMKQSRGLIQVYTGEGKGKTTAALGLALRAVGQGMKVIVIQFIKGDPTCGEHLFAAQCPVFDIIQMNPKSSFDQTSEELKPTTEQTLALAEKALLSGEYDVVILDEILVAINMGVVSTERILSLISKKPEPTELILTGRGAPEEIIKQADLVTEMMAVKHPFTRGINARRGIEY